MTKTEEWAFDGQLDATETPTTSPAEERAKIAALFAKPAPEQKASEPIDYAAAFAAHKGKQAPELKAQEQVKREQETPSQTDSEDDITAGSISLQHHVHTGVQGGSENTETPS